MVGGSSVLHNRLILLQQYLSAVIKQTAKVLYNELVGRCDLMYNKHSQSMLGATIRQPQQ